MLTGEILLERGLITPEQLDQALELRSRTNFRIGECLVHLGFIEEHAITRCLSEQYDLPIADLSKVVPSARALGLMPCSFALSRLILPLDIVDNVLGAIISDPIDIESSDEVIRNTGYRLELWLAPAGALSEAIARWYSLSQGEYAEAA